MSKQQHTPTIKAMREAEQFPKNTCAASRHTAMIAEALIRGVTYHALTDEPDNCGDSMAATVAALWEARTENAQLRARVEVAEAGFSAAASKAQWQSVTNRELNSLREVNADLLAALKAILADGVHCDVVPHLHEKARAAIKRAEGEK